MPCGELGLALYEMYDISGLSIREILYEKYVPTGKELHLLKTQYPSIYDTYWELLYHYHICAHMTSIWHHGIKQKGW